MVSYSYGVARRWIRGPRVLELSPAEGHMTDVLGQATYLLLWAKRSAGINHAGDVFIRKMRTDGQAKVSPRSLF